MESTAAQKKTLLVTGPNGFIGRNLLGDIQTKFPSWRLKVISRHPVSGIDDCLDFESFRLGKCEKSFFAGVTHLVHLAGVAHRFNQLKEEELNSVNIDFLKEVLAQLDPSTLQKVVFLSSYSVTLLKKGIELDTKIYGLTKQRAESVLRDWYSSTSQKCELVILRPAMVYGRGAPGNFDRVLRALRLPVLLPFGGLDFDRCFIHVRNLTSAIVAVINAPIDPGIYQWDISDPWVETFNGFVRDLNIAISGKAKILSLSLPTLKWTLALVGKRELFNKLVLTFQIDVNPFCEKYHWQPVLGFKERFEDLRG